MPTSPTKEIVNQKRSNVESTFKTNLLNLLNYAKYKFNYYCEFDSFLNHFLIKFDCSVGQANSVRGSMTGIGKITTGVAVVFMLTSLTLAYLSSETARDSVVRDLKPVANPTVSPEQMQIPEEVTKEESPEIPPAELEQKVAPPIESSSDN